MFKYLGSFALGVCLLAPISLVAQDHGHQWNDSESPTWHQYLKEHHKKDHDWSKASKHEQQDYWKWRDQNRDHVHEGH